MHRESSLYLCIEKQCQQNILISNSKDFLTHKLHNFITLSEFTIKFEPTVIRQLYDEENKKQIQLEELKESILAQFKILLETYMRVSKTQETLLNEIIEEWGSENSQFLRQNQFRIRDLWFKEQKQRQIAEESQGVKDFKELLEMFRSFNQIVAQNEKEDAKQLLISNSLKNLSLIKKTEPINRKYEPIILSDSDNQRQIYSPRSDGTVFGVGTIYSKFSEELKHTKMLLTSPIRIKSTANTPMIALANLPLDLTSSVQKFGFKHVAGSLNVAFGVCHFETVKKKSYAARPGVGEGMYVIQNDGSLYSHTEDLTKNTKPFRFLHHHPIYCYLVPKDNRLIFKQPKSNEQMEIKVKSQGQMIPCVAVTTADQEIEVLQPYEIPDL